MSGGMVFCLTSKTDKVSLRDLRTIASAVQNASKGFALDWGIKTPVVRAVEFVGQSHIDASDVVVTVVDSSSEDGALGYHSEEDGTVYAEIAAGDILKAGGKLFASGSYLGVSVVISHEVFETALNPHVNLWVDRGDGVIEDAYEACDAVQGRSFNALADGPRPISVAVSNYLLPAWFCAQSKGPKFDKMGLCKKPFEVLHDGYHVIRRTSIEHAEDGPKAVRKLEALGSAQLVARAKTKRRPSILHEALARPHVVSR